MKICIFLVLFILSLSAHAQETENTPPVVKIPYMERAGFHRDYADALLNLALELSKDRFGSYELIQQTQQMVIRRQLLELQKGENLSVAVSMPMPEWLNSARIVQFPIMKGLASYRLFFAHERNLEILNNIDNLDTLKAYKIGQGFGWSTAKILEDNGFQVVYGTQYHTLFPMLHGDRFQLLMRGAYEITPELDLYKPAMPGLVIVDSIAVYTYLPMYFFVSKDQPILADRLEYGLKKAHENGQLDELFNQYFSETLELLNKKQRHIFYLRNTNIDRTFYERDKPYLLDAINKLEAEHNPEHIEQ
jgi:ABC-type amino acid transport substrate-binding protein